MCYGKIALTPFDLVEQSSAVRDARLELEQVEHVAHRAHRGRSDRQAEHLLGGLDRRQRLHLDARRKHDRVGVGDLQPLPLVEQAHWVAPRHLEVVRNLEGDAVEHLDALVLDVAHHLAGERLDVRREERDLARAELLQAVDQGARRGHDLRARAVLRHHLLEVLLDLAVVARALRHDGHQAGRAHQVDARIGKLGGAAQPLLVHRRELLGRHALHAHARGMEREALCEVLLAGAQHRRDLGLHRRVGRRHDLADAHDAARAAGGGRGAWPRPGPYASNQAGGGCATPMPLRTRITFHRKMLEICSTRAEPFTRLCRSKSGWNPIWSEKRASPRSTAPMMGLAERTWLTMKISPSGLHTRCSSRSRRAGSCTTDTTYIATTLSKLPSGKSMACASISCRPSTLVSPRRRTRTRALSSISRERSTPVTRTNGGYSGSERPVPTPTSSTRWPGRHSRTSRTALRPGCSTGPNRAS